MQLVTLDMETYYDSDFTLKGKGISTSEYIRDKRFEAISCSIKINNRVPFCYFGKEAIAKALAKIKWDKATLLAHHAHFDGLILSHHFGHVPARYADTLSMARALHPKGTSNRLADVAILYNKVNKLSMPDFKGKHVKDLTKAERKAIAEYNNRDVESCYEIYQEMLKNFPVPELDLIDITVRMFADPVLKVNLAKAKRELKREQTAKSDAIKAAGVDAEVLSSGPKFTAALEAAGVDVPTKPSPSVPNKIIPAIAKSDEDFQALLTHPNPKVVALVEGRLAVKSTIGESRALRLINHAKPALPVYLNYALAHTLRWTGGDKLNTQNFKQKQKVGGELRQCITAPSGKVQVVVDAAQIEARVVAWLADEEWILEAFREKRDLYSEFASKAYGRPIDRKRKEIVDGKVIHPDEAEGFVGKTCIAEGELVLTNEGLIPIQEIKSRHKLWDGVQWVSHEGLIYKGIQNVITYRGLTATSDHIVVTEDGRAIPLRQAASEMVGLERTEIKGSPIRTSHCDFLTRSSEERASRALLSVLQVLQEEVDKYGQFNWRKNKRVPSLLPDQVKTFQSTWEAIRCYYSAMHTQTKQILQRLWRSGDKKLIRVSDEFHPVGGEESATRELQRGGDRSEEQRRSLRAEEYAACYTPRTGTEQKKHGAGVLARQADSTSRMEEPVQSRPYIQTSNENGLIRRTDYRKVYDIVNAGPRHCFTVSGKLVFNCILGLGYGMGGPKLQTSVLTKSIEQGLAPIRLPLEVCSTLVGTYRSECRNIEKLWYTLNNVGIASLITGDKYKYKCLTFGKEHVKLPNGLALLYPGTRANIAKMRFGEERVFDASYNGNKSRSKLYGGLLTENIVQALARIIVADVMRIVAQKYRVVMMTHDEIVFLASKSEGQKALDWAIGLMSVSPSWAPNLPLSAEGGYGVEYAK